MFTDFREKEKERKTERNRERQRNIEVREKHQMVASRTHPDWDQTYNRGTCPDWGSNPQPFGVWDDTPTN